MRLWHYKLLPVLPRQQLLGQWRECCLIAKSIHDKGTPNHILVNPIMNYPIDHFIEYQVRVAVELKMRGYNVDPSKFIDYLYGDNKPEKKPYIPIYNLFPGWHTDEYYKQCYYNLEEKHDRGGITDEEWQLIKENRDWMVK